VTKWLWVIVFNSKWASDCEWLFLTPSEQMIVSDCYSVTCSLGVKDNHSQSLAHLELKTITQSLVHLFTWELKTITHLLIIYCNIYSETCAIWHLRFFLHPVTSNKNLSVTCPIDTIVWFTVWNHFTCSRII
jgi:hypothetical protein